MPVTRRLSVLALCAATLPLLATACSSGATSGSTTTRPTGHPEVTSACALVTPAQIARTLGKVVGAPGVTTATRTTVCTFPAQVASDTVIVGFRAGVTDAAAGSEQAKLRRQHGILTDVSGAGFSAFYYTKASGKQTITGLVTLNGGTQVSVTSTASAARSEALTKEIFASLAARATASTTTTTSGQAATTVAP